MKHRQRTYDLLKPVLRCVLAAFSALGLLGAAFGLLASPAGAATSGYWTVAPVPDGYPVGSTSCPSTTFCGALFDGADFTTWNGSAWSDPVPITAASPPNSYPVTSFSHISCASQSFCMAVGTQQVSVNTINPIYATWNGNAWSGLLPTPSAGYRRLQCFSSTSCVTAGSSEPLMFWNGSTWSEPGQPVNGWRPWTFSCVSANFCMMIRAYEGGSYAMVWNGSSYDYGTQYNFPSNESVGAVACPSANFCMAAGVFTNPSTDASSANYFTWTSTSGWSAMQPMPGVSEFPNPVQGTLTCPSASLCMSVSNGFVTWTPGGGWQVPSSQPSGLLTTITCPTSTYCLVSAYETGTSTYQTDVYNAPPPAPTVSSFSPTSGPGNGGTAVTIYGTNLSEATSVTFGSAEAISFVVASPTEITATTPAGSGSVPISVTTPGGTATPAPTFTYGPAITSTYYPVGPTRICDTRPGNPSNLSGQAAQCNNHTLPGFGVFRVCLPSTVPTSATAAEMNVTVTDTLAPGYLTVWPGGTMPTTSSANWTPGQTVANGVTVPLSSGCFDVYNGSVRSADIVVDLTGYFAPASTGGLYQPIAPTRICDTRSGNPSNLSGQAAQCNNANFDASQSIKVCLPTSAPSGVMAAEMNVTAIGGSDPGYLTIWPGGTMPTTSSVNWTPGQIVANGVLVPVSSSGCVDLYNGSGSAANVVVDLTGYVLPSASSSLHLIGPTRICDTRTGNPSDLSRQAAQCNGRTLAAKSTLNVTVAGLAGVPSGASAVVANVTVTNTASGGYLTVWPGGTMPTASSVNWTGGQTVANNVVIPLSAGQVSIYDGSAASTDVIVDVTGYYG